jgi:hypothetical protein
MKLRIHLTIEETHELANRMPARVRLSAEFVLDVYLVEMQTQRDKYRLPNIPDAKECKYIFGEVFSGEAYYCGKPTLEGASWCKKHHDLCTRTFSKYEDQYNPRKHGRFY